MTLYSAKKTSTYGYTTNSSPRNSRTTSITTTSIPIKYHPPADIAKAASPGTTQRFVG